MLRCYAELNIKNKDVTHNSTQWNQIRASQVRNFDFGKVKIEVWYTSAEDSTWQLMHILLEFCLLLVMLFFSSSYSVQTDQADVLLNRDAEKCGDISLSSEWRERMKKQIPRWENPETDSSYEVANKMISSWRWIKKWQILVSRLVSIWENGQDSTDWLTSREIWRRMKRKFLFAQSRDEGKEIWIFLNILLSVRTCVLAFSLRLDFRKCHFQSLQSHDTEIKSIAENPCKIRDGVHHHRLYQMWKFFNTVKNLTF